MLTFGALVALKIIYLAVLYSLQVNVIVLQNPEVLKSEISNTTNNIKIRAIVSRLECRRSLQKTAQKKTRTLE